MLAMVSMCFGMIETAALQILTKKQPRQKNHTEKLHEYKNMQNLVALAVQIVDNKCEDVQQIAANPRETREKRNAVAAHVMATRYSKWVVQLDHDQPMMNAHSSGF